MLNNIVNKFFKTTISYGVTVCNESKELNGLLKFLVENKDWSDEIIVLQDVTNQDENVDKVISDFQKNITLIKAKLDGDFSKFKNKLIEKSNKNFIFQIDADEVPTESLMRKLKPFLSENRLQDIFFVPRINTVEGITAKHIEQWNWRIDDNGYINFPDFQPRIFRTNRGIHWENKVHEQLVGSDRHQYLPTENFDYCLLHPKKIEKQVQQNDFYDKL